MGWGRRSSWWSFDNASFKGPNGQPLNNINIEIKDARHNDFSYTPNDYADHTNWNAQKARQQIVNRRTNLFMRDLYQAALADQTEPERLKGFFTSLERTGAAKYENGIWKIDPNYLRDVRLS